MTVVAKPGGTSVAATGPAPAETSTPTTALLASLVVVVVGLDVHLPLGTSAALLLAVLLLPLWLPVLPAYRLATLVCALSALCVVSGLVLAELSAVDHAVDRIRGLQSIGLLASGVAALVLILWARTELPLHRVVLLYGAGAVAGALVHGDYRWKFTLAMPVALIVLALLERTRTWVIPVVALLGIGILSVADEGRSLFGASVLVATLATWQHRPRSSGRRVWRWFPLVALAGVAVAVYVFATALATGGELGEAVRETSTRQVRSDGSLITGGRPEWAATRELVRLKPAGYGVGVVPDWTDRMTGKAGLASIGVDVDPFREQYMFGAQLELHSIAADLWAGYGWAGVALAAVVTFALVRSLSFALAGGQAPTYVLFAGVMALWYMLFGPIGSNWLDVCAALGFALVAADPPGSARVAAA
ncbi:MAG TPA: hypothetical protein VH479_14750 [Acidimicrobiales bacterium]